MKQSLTTEVFTFKVFVSVTLAQGFLCQFKIKECGLDCAFSKSTDCLQIQRAEGMGPEP